MAQRLTYRRRCSYNTRSNRVKAVKTPGKPQNNRMEKE
jgi:large subunit ribosomal protein L34e